MNKQRCSHQIQDPITGKFTSTLTYTTDMGCWSFSLPAGPNGACPLSIVDDSADGSKKSICKSCYALGNRYSYSNVMKAQYARFRWLKYCFQQGEVGVQFAIDALTWAIRDNAGSKGYFRWFDSGDFFCPEMIMVVTAVCKNLPGIRFWIPSRTYHTPNQKWQVLLSELAKLPNVSMRPSAIYFNDEAPDVIDWASGTSAVFTVNDAIHGNNLCAKSVLGGSCESNGCRECWNKNGKPVSYLIHGLMGRHKTFDGMSNGFQEPRKRLQSLTISGLKNLRKQNVNQD